MNTTHQVINNEQQAIVKKAAINLRALNHPLRRHLLEALKEAGQLTVSELYIKLRMEQSVCSQHLAILRRAKLVTTIRSGKFINYKIDQDRIDHVLALSEQLN